jgi:UDP-glucose 4-epimerase
MKVLVVGGAGYIGSFTVKVLKEAGYDVVIFDSLETGHQEAIGDTPLYQGNLQTDVDKLDEVFKKENPEAVIHFAAYIEVGESVKNPQKYYFNNVIGTLKLLKAMNANDCKKIVFSSTAAVYGEPEKIPIKETDEKQPTNPYGQTKLSIENALNWYSSAYGLKAVPLRYFNAVGAALDGSMGQDYPKPTHLITRACEAALGQRDDFAIFGDDYNTPDGTCIRDYIHVLDLADAHLKALEYLNNKSESVFEPFNVGTGNGYSVKEVVDMVKQVSGNDFNVPIVERRPGDPDKLVADSTKLQQTLNWKPKHSDLKTIISSAYQWHKKHPNGYGN